jgi:hypothetical protein
MYWVGFNTIVSSWFGFVIGLDNRLSSISLVSGPEATILLSLFSTIASMLVTYRQASFVTFVTTGWFWVTAQVGCSKGDFGGLQINDDPTLHRHDSR